MSLSQRPVSVSVDCSAKIDHLANFLLSLSQVESQKGSEVMIGRASGHPSTLLLACCVFCRLEESQIDNPLWTILNINSVQIMAGKLEI